MNYYNWNDFGALAPALLLAAGGCVLLMCEVFLRSRQRAFLAGLSTSFAAVAGVVSWALATGEGRELFHGLARLDAFGGFIAVIVCFSLAVTSLLGWSSLKEQASERGEFYALSHFAAAGMVLMATSTDLITLFVALEVMSLATYALTAYLRNSARPAEAALKYFILGAFSSAVLLYGMALAYGAAGSTRLADVAHAAANNPGFLIYTSVALMLGGFFFKVAAVPFHTWAPDVYEGAPSTVTGFMAAGVKAAAFAALLRVLYLGFGNEEVSLGSAGGKGWYAAVSAVAYLTMIGGNVLAVVQKSVKRMLAYSSISHAGYALMAVAAGAHTGAREGATQAVLFYLAAYTAMALGAFGVVAALERRGGPEADDDHRYDGLAQREPVLAALMTVFILSLASVPGTVGFVGKLFVVRSALEVNAIGLAVVALLSSVVGLYYYLRVLVLMYMRPSPSGALVPSHNAGMRWGLAVSAAATLIFGIFAAPLVDFARLAAGMGG